MVFGSDEFFQILKKAISESDESIYYEMYNVVSKDLAPLKHRSRIPDNAFEDIMQEIQLCLFLCISDFIIRSEDKHPNQRNAWLVRLAKNKVNDYIKKCNKKTDKNTYSEWQLVSPEDELKSIIDAYEDSSANIEDNYFGTIDQLEMRDEFFDICEYICKEVKSPENLFVFFFNKVIIPHYKGTRSGSPKEVRELSSGKTLTELRDILVLELEMILCYKIPVTVFQELDLKIANSDNSHNKIFVMTDAKISDITNKIQKKIQNKTQKSRNTR